jgi:RNA polymerase sigma-70 factor (ECF subfamily)
MAEVSTDVEIEKRKLAEKIFEKDFFPHADAMYNFALKLTTDPDDANDLLQDTFLKAFKYIDSFEEGTNAKAWLFRILKNNFINDYRKKVRNPIISELETFENLQPTDSDEFEPDINQNFKTETLQDLMGDEVTLALQSLATDFRIIIILSDLEDFTYEEIGKILNIPIGTVRSRLHRAREILKLKLVDFARKKGFNTDSLS